MRIVAFILAFFAVGSLSAQKPFSGDEAIVKSEFIYDVKDVSFPSCHASTIVEIENGLLAAWFGGTYERHPDVGIWISSFENGKWSAPVEVANGIQHKDLRYPTWNPVLFSTGKEIKLFYKEGPNCSDWWGEVITSTDNGKTWSEPIHLPEEIWGPIKDKPVLLKTGELLCPSSTELDGWQVHMEITPDFGKTWVRTKSLNDGHKLAAIQPTILQHENGKLQALCRTKSQKIYTTWSEDNARTWTEMEALPLPNPNSGIDAVTLKNGKHILVYNHTVRTKEGNGRHELNVAVSDDGLNWKAALVLENDTDKKAEYSYPAVIQTEDGLVHITYTWHRTQIKHVVVDPVKLVTKPIVDGQWPE